MKTDEKIGRMKTDEKIDRMKKDGKMEIDETDEINKLTHKIIGCAMEVHNQMGNGFQEVVCQLL